jgi:hypothetical protein
MPRSFIKSTIECRQSSFSDECTAIPESTFSTSTEGGGAAGPEADDEADAFAAGVAGAEGAAGALAAAFAEVPLVEPVVDDVDVAGAEVECPNTFDIIDPRTLIVSSGTLSFWP